MKHALVMTMFVLSCSKPDAEASRATSSAAPSSASATPAASAPPSVTASAPPVASSAAPGNVTCEITKRIHTCQLSKPPCAGPCGEGMFACPPEEAPAVNTVFRALGDAKTAVAACGKSPGATAGTFVFKGTVADTQKGGRLAMTATSGSGPAIDCLANALGTQLPQGGDVMKRAYALEVHVACK